MPTALVSWSTEVFFIPSVTAQCLVSFSNAFRSCSVSKSVKAKVVPPEIWPFWFFRSYYIILLSALQEVSEKNSFFCGRKDKVPMNSTSRRWNEKHNRRTMKRRNQPAGHTGRQQSALQKNCNNCNPATRRNWLNRSSGNHRVQSPQPICWWLQNTSSVLEITQQILQNG